MGLSETEIPLVVNVVAFIEGNHTIFIVLLGELLKVVNSSLNSHIMGIFVVSYINYFVYEDDLSNLEPS